MSDELRERIARALWKCDGSDFSGTDEWELLDPLRRNGYFRRADAVLDVLTDRLRAAVFSAYINQMGCDETDLDDANDARAFVDAVFAMLREVRDV